MARGGLWRDSFQCLSDGLEGVYGKACGKDRYLG